MGKTVVLAGALDTKGAEFSYVRQVIRRAGLDALTVDFGVLGEPSFIPDISRAEVAQVGGGDLERWRSGEHKDTTPLLTVEETDKALAKTVDYRPPGKK